MSQAWSIFVLYSTQPAMLIGPRRVVETGRNQSESPLEINSRFCEIKDDKGGRTVSVGSCMSSFHSVEEAF